jgi:hypothetical protein
VNPIAAENAKSGDPQWMNGFNRPKLQQIEAYADRVSAKAGEQVNLMVRSAGDSTAVWALYRIGWYGGAGARQILPDTSIAVREQTPCSNEKATGLVRCSWRPAFTVTIPSDAVSGLYLVRIVRKDRIGVIIPVVVKDDRPADLYFQSSVTTAQAYNAWDGESLYSDSHDGLGFAVQVSFDRPYDMSMGSGQVTWYEVLFARFLERYGYDVSYTTNLDVTRGGARGLLQRGAFLSVGHDEYWDGRERIAVQAARDAGLPLFFFGANAAYWKTREEKPGVDGNPRIITCYKRNPEQDPLAGTPQETARYRDDPVANPEEALVGGMYESFLLFGEPWRVSNANDPLYAGTGLKDGDIIQQLVGNEYDRTFALDTPAPVSVISESPMISAEGRPGIQQATWYRTGRGAFVFDAGTEYWSRFVDGPQSDPRVQRMTANALAIGRGLPVPSELQSIGAGPPPPPSAPAWASSVQTIAKGMPGPTSVAPLPDGSFVVADPVADRIWRVDTAGAVTPYAGDGTPGGPHFDDRPALEARFLQPSAVLSDKAGNVYVADTRNGVIRKIANDPQHTVKALAGAFNIDGYADGVGSQARFHDAVALDFLDDQHIVIADSGNHALRVLDLETNFVSTLAISRGGFDDVDGPAGSAVFFYPTAVAVAPDRRVFFVASSTGKLKVVGNDPQHTVTTLTRGGLGFADGAGTSAMLQPQAGLLWLSGNLIVADTLNQRLRVVTPGVDAASTRVATWAGNGTMSSVDGAAEAASFMLPLGLALGRDGLVYAADGGAGTLRAVLP